MKLLRHKKVSGPEEKKAKVRLTKLAGTRVKTSTGQTCQQNSSREFSGKEVKWTSSNELPLDDQMEPPASEQAMQEDALWFAVDHTSFSTLTIACIAWHLTSMSKKCMLNI